MSILYNRFRYKRELFSRKSYLLPSLYGRGWGVGLFLALFSFTTLYAQETDDTSDDGVEGLKAPKRTLQVDKNTTIQLRGVVIPIYGND